MNSCPTQSYAINPREKKMTNKVFTVTIYGGKTLRILFNDKLQTYFIEVKDLLKVLDIRTKDLPAKYQGKVTYVDVTVNEKTVRYSSVAEEDFLVMKNFSRNKNVDSFTASILETIENIKMSYSGYIKGMILPQAEQDALVQEVERKTRRINILEGQVNNLKEGARNFMEFTDNTALVPLRRVVEKLRYKTTYEQLLGHLRQCGALDASNTPESNLVEKGIFRYFIWSTKIGDKEKQTTQIVVSEKGIKYINEVLEKANGKNRRKWKFIVYTKWPSF